MSKFFFEKSVPSYLLLVSLIAGGAGGWWLHNAAGAGNTEAGVSNVVQESIGTASYCGVKPERIKGYDYVAPLLMVETECESGELNALKNELTQFFNQQKASGQLADAAFYFRDITKLGWTGINQDKLYFPGSLMKVPQLLALLSAEEEHPGLLDKKVHYGKAYVVDKNPHFITKQLPENNDYTIRELIRYMITYSDNNATMLLLNYLQRSAFEKVFIDFGLRPLDWTNNTYPISAREYSMFMRSIYNSSYLSINHSEYAAELLSTCDFKEGFLKGIPPGTKLIHKFGEGGEGNDRQLHESAIMYVNGKPFLLTVMTRGADLKSLSGVLAGSAGIVFKYLSSAG